jgi:hypothetical protein
VRAVVDTNLFVSGLLWGGSPKRLVAAAQEGVLRVCGSDVLLAELGRVLARPKFRARLIARGVTADAVLGASGLDGVGARIFGAMAAALPTIGQHRRRVKKGGLPAEWKPLDRGNGRAGTQTIKHNLFQAKTTPSSPAERRNTPQGLSPRNRHAPKVSALGSGNLLLKVAKDRGAKRGGQSLIASREESCTLGRNPCA